jgi:hypothetical protein
MHYFLHIFGLWHFDYFKVYGSAIFLWLLSNLAKFLSFEAKKCLGLIGIITTQFS